MSGEVRVRRPKELFDRVGELLKEAAAHRHEQDFGLVDWDRLECVGIEARWPMYPHVGSAYWVAHVEPVDPDAVLAAWLVNVLIDEGWDDIDVQCLY